MQPTKTFLASVFILLLPSLGQGVTLAPLNPGMELTCQFVNNSGYPDNQVYIAVIARDAANTVCYLNAAGAMIPVAGGQNVSMYSMTLNTFSGLQFPSVMTSGRLWISYGAPMNMPTFAGGGIAQPNLGNPGDPNVNTVFDWMEFNVGGGRIFCNTTQVDMFGIPYTMELYDDAGLNSIRGIPYCYSDVVSRYQAFMNSIPGAGIFNSLVGSRRIVAPGHGSFAAGQPNGSYFDAYIASIWSGPFRPAGVSQPTTQDVFGASGPLATQAQVDASMNRHVQDQPGNVNNPAAYYQSGPANYYGAFWHTVNLAGKAYGFPYDDANDQSSLQVSDHPRALVINLSGCVPTPTCTVTPSRTFTPTSTYSVTVSRTSTPTSTVTPSATATCTRTSTATLSVTVTRTSTSTVTPTRTSTATGSATPSNTHTPSVTPSATASSTLTVTATDTASVTGTVTPSTTLTATPTSSGTPDASATCTLTATASASVTLTATQTRTASATTTASPSATPSSSQTVTRSETALLTVTATRTVTATVTPSSVGTDTRTLTPTQSATPTTTLSATGSSTSTVGPSATATPLPMLYLLILGVYNSAGERVNALYEGPATVGPGTLKLDRDSLALGGPDLQIQVPGLLPGGVNTLPWDGRSDAGQTVSTGVYYIKMQTIDPFGTTSAVILPLSVVDARPQQSLDVFNSAGERVRSLILPPAVGTNGFDLGSDTLLVGQSDLPGLKIDVRLGQGQVLDRLWDGKNEAGEWVAGGVYSVMLISRQGSEVTRVMTKSVQVLRAPEVDAAAEAHPLENPLPPTQGALRITYGYRAGLRASAELFNLAGERVAQGDDEAQGGLVRLDVQRLSPGVYLVRLQVSEGGRISGRRTLKVAILR